MNSISRRSCLGLAAALGAHGCGAKSKPKVQKTARVGLSALLGPGGVYYLTEELGYFRDEAIRTEVETSPSVSVFVPMMVSGKLDVLIGALSPALVNSAALGTGLRIVLARESAKPDCSTWGSIYGRKKSFPNRLADLKELDGKKIAYTNRGAVTEFALDMLIESAGLTRDRVHGVILRQAEAIGALAAGQIDGVLMTGHAPQGAGALKTEAELFPGITKVHPGQQSGFVVFGNSLRSQDRDAGRRFLRALLRGTREFLNGKTPAALAKLAAANGIDLEAARTACRETVVADGKVDMESIRRYLNWAHRKKYLDRAVAPEELVDSSLLTELGA